MGKGILILIIVVIVAIIGFMYLSPSAPISEYGLDTTESDVAESDTQGDVKSEGGVTGLERVVKEDGTMAEGDYMEDGGVMEGTKTADGTMEDGGSMAKKEDSGVMEKAEPVVIKMTADGFSPTTVTVSAGTEVQFVNSDVRSHWPASDVHPTHLVLPEFDARGAVLPGESYSFTFTKKGGWSMHDHLFPARKGKIVVQ